MGEMTDTMENNFKILDGLLWRDFMGIRIVDCLDLGALHGLIQFFEGSMEGEEPTPEQQAKLDQAVRDMKIAWYAEMEWNKEKGQIDAKMRRKQNALNSAAKARENKTWAKKKQTN